MTLIINSNIVLECDSKEVVRQCIRENTFDNHLYISNERNGRSNWKTKSAITTYRYEGENLILPRGYLRSLLKIFRESDITTKIIDERVSNPCAYPEKLNGIVLRDYQQRAVAESMKFDQGCIVSPTGSGKSVMALEAIRRRGQKTLIIVHRGELARQWVSVIKERMGIIPGLIGDGEWTIGDQITVAMVQTLSSRKNEVKTLSNAFGLVLVDEQHHIPASTFFDVLGLLNAKFRYGFSATVERRDGLEQMIYRGIGPIIEEISRDEVEDTGSVIAPTVIAIETGFNPGLVNSWSEYLDSLSGNSERNLLLIDLSQQSEDGSVLILVDRVAHAEQLSEMLERRNIDHVLAHGKIKDRENVMEQIKSSKLTVGTTSLLGEGLDVNAWSVLIMGAPISSEIKLLQNIGRIVRPSNGKKAFVYDLRDDCGFSGASFKKRFEIYKKNKIWVEFRENKKAARTV